jgi:hypothetical protein
VEPASWPELERLAAANVKRVFSAGPGSAAPNGDSWAAAPDPRRMLAFLETKTVWHPMGT